VSKKLKLVKVGWYDHCSFTENHWRTIEEYDDLSPFYIETVGWVIKETKKYIIVVSTLSESGKVLGDMCILKNTTKFIKELE
jgi:hypothetical protein